MKRVSGVDPSLTSTGVAVVTATEDVGGDQLRRVPGRTFLTTGAIKSDVSQGEGEHPAVYEVRRVADIVAQVCVSVAGSELVYIESPAYASRTGKYTERAHLYYSLLAALVVRGIPFDVVPPTTLKKRVTGSGRATKDSVLHTVRDAWSERGWGDTPKQGIHDRADAAGLAWCAAVDQAFDVPGLAVTGTRSTGIPAA